MKPEDKDRYQSLIHAMQTGVAHKMTLEGEGGDTSPKHLRVGVNVALVESSALWKLLVDKGIITEDEMMERLLAAHRDEVDNYEQYLTNAYGGSKVRLV